MLIEVLHHFLEIFLCLHNYNSLTEAKVHIYIVITLRSNGGLHKYHGFFALVANKEKDTFEALSKYRKRNTIEAFFRSDKQTADGLRPRVWSADTLRGRMFVQFVAMCYYEFFSEQLRQLKKSLGTATGDEKHDTKVVLEAERKLKAWIDNTPVYLQLQWFDTVENVKVSSVLTNKRWTTEITSRDALYLEKLGVKLTV